MSNFNVSSNRRSRYITDPFQDAVSQIQINAAAAMSTFFCRRSTIEAVLAARNLGWIVIRVATVAFIAVTRKGRNTLAQRPPALAG
jgi:hypothetical protein